MNQGTRVCLLLASVAACVNVRVRVHVCMGEWVGVLIERMCVCVCEGKRERSFPVSVKMKFQSLQFN